MIFRVFIQGDNIKKYLQKRRGFQLWMKKSAF